MNKHRARAPWFFNQQPPDLDELFSRFSKKLQGSLGTRGSGPSGPPVGNSGGSKAFGGLLIAALLMWLGSGFFIVQEGQQAVITQFGKYKTTVGAGFNWRMPYPIERHESVYVSQIRSIDVGKDTLISATGLKDSAMLTEDENIVEIKFAVQYRLNDARAYLFSSSDPDASVLRAAETALREVVGKMRLDAVLAEERDQIAPRVRSLMQTILDRYNVGIEVVGINLQQGGVRPPEQVQAAFDDVLKAGQERERAKNEAEAYANDIIPRAKGTSDRLLQEAAGYKEKIIASAQGDAQRFSLLQSEHAKSPKVTRERLYLETMEQVYSNVTKVMVDSSKGAPLLYLPLDKLQQAASATAPSAVAPTPSSPPLSARSPETDRNVSRERQVR